MRNTRLTFSCTITTCLLIAMAGCTANSVGTSQEGLVLAVDLTGCCPCPRWVEEGTLGSTLVAYEEGRDYIGELATECSDVACSPCPFQVTPDPVPDPPNDTCGGVSVLAIDVSGCCGCPYWTSDSNLSSTVLVYEEGRDYSAELPAECGEVACSPCPFDPPNDGTTAPHVDCGDTDPSDPPDPRTDDPTTPPEEPACVFALDVSVCCACPTAAWNSDLTETLLEYEDGRDYSAERPAECSEVACSPCEATPDVAECGGL